MTDRITIPEQQVWNLWISWSSQRSSNSQKSVELMEKNKRVPSHQPTPIHKLSMMSMVWNISVGQFGLAAWLYSPPQLLHTG